VNQVDETSMDVDTWPGEWKPRETIQKSRSHQKSGRNQPERVAGLNRNRWPLSAGKYNHLNHSWIYSSPGFWEGIQTARLSGWQKLQSPGKRRNRPTISSVCIASLVRELRGNLVEKAKVCAEDNLVQLQMEYVRDEQQPTLTLKKFERAESPIRAVLKVEKKAGEALMASDLGLYPFPSEYKVVTEVVKNWFPGVAPTLSVPRPLGSIVPAKHQDVIEVLLGHGLQVEILVADKTLEVEAYVAGEVIPSKYDYLPPEKIEVEKKIFQTIVKKGDFYVSCSQAGANLIPCLLEPQSQYGLIRYWAFKLVPEKGDIFAFYRLIKPEPLPLLPYRNWVR
jgi:hypothetical protein